MRHGQPHRDDRNVTSVEAHRRQLGGFTARHRPAFGTRPTVRFALVASVTLAYTAFSVWFSQPWRAELEDALGPVMSWVIPVLLAYVPGVVIGFLCATLLLTRYRPPPLDPPGARGRPASGRR